MAEQSRPLFRDRNVHYEIRDKAQGLHCGGIGALHLLVQPLGLADAIDRDLHLLQRHVPYFESDHVLNLTSNLLAGGTCLQDLELLRPNENYLDGLDAQRIPDPTTADDFLRRFDAADLDTLMRILHDQRVGVWKQQPEAFREQALLEADGTRVGTTGECKQGVDLSYNGVGGYHPLLVSLANTQEPLFIHNRSASRPRYEGAADYFDRAAELCRQAGFRHLTFRGDTDFTQAAHLDRWDQEGIRFVFGIDAQPNLVARAEQLPERVWQTLPRPDRHEVATVPRTRPVNTKQEVVVKKGYMDIRLASEPVAEFNYRPGACGQDYLVVVLRKYLIIEKKGQQVGEEVRCFFSITNPWTWEPAAVVYFANDRCN